MEHEIAFDTGDGFPIHTLSPESLSIDAEFDKEFDVAVFGSNLPYEPILEPANMCGYASFGIYMARIEIDRAWENYLKDSCLRAEENLKVSLATGLRKVHRNTGLEGFNILVSKIKEIIETHTKGE